MDSEETEINNGNKYYIRNRERLLKYQKEYREKHKDELNEKRKQNKEAINEKIKEYSKQKDQNWQSINISNNMEILMVLKELKEEDLGSTRSRKYQIPKSFFWSRK